MSKGSQKRRTVTRKAGEKCGTCRFFVARNTEEAKLATYARDESECGPGEWVFQGVRKAGCHGGPVYGHCQKAGQLSGPGQEPFPPSRVASTFWCRLWRMADGLQIRQSGSVNRAADTLESGGAVLALGAVALLAAVAQWKRKGSSNVDGVFVGVNEAYTLFDEGEITLAETRERMRGACGDLKSGSQIPSRMQEKLAQRRTPSLLAMVATTGIALSGQQWLQWGRDSRLNKEFDGEGQLMFYTDDPAVASEAQRLGASIEKDNEGQLVIYTDVVVAR